MKLFKNVRATVLAAIVTVIGLVLVAGINYFSSIAPVQMEIRATKTAEYEATQWATSIHKIPTLSPENPSINPTSTIEAVDQITLITIEHLSWLAFRGNTGRTDGFRITNLSGSSISIVGYGAQFISGPNQFSYTCSEYGQCNRSCGFEGTDLPEPIFSACLKVLPEEVFFEERFSYDSVYPLTIESNTAIDFVTSEDLVLDPPDVSLDPSIVIIYEFYLADGSTIKAIPLVAAHSGGE